MTAKDCIEYLLPQLQPDKADLSPCLLAHALGVTKYAGGSRTCPYACFFEMSADHQLANRASGCCAQADQYFSDYARAFTWGSSSAQAVYL